MPTQKKKQIKVRRPKKATSKRVKPAVAKIDFKKISAEAREEVFTPAFTPAARLAESKLAQAGMNAPVKAAARKKNTGNNKKKKVVSLSPNQDGQDDAIIKKRSGLSDDPPTSSKSFQCGKSPSLGLYRKIALSFIILTLALVAVIFYFSFVKVTIVLIPNQERISDNLIVDIYDKDQNTVISQGAITGQVGKQEVEQTKIYSAGRIEVIGEETTGKVTITNNYNKNQPLVATTRLLSPDKKLFRIKNTVMAPAGGSVEVDVYADEPGQDMAIGPSRFTIPGLWAGLQDKIYAESKDSFVYSQKVKKYIAQADIDAGVKDLKNSLLSKAREKVSEDYKKYDKVLYDILDTSVSTAVDGKVGEEKNEFSITMATDIIVVAFNENEVVEIAKNKLLSVIPSDKELIEFKESDLTYSLDGYNISNGAATVNISFEGKMSLKQGARILDREKLLGLTREQLGDYLDKNAPEVAGYEIFFSPSFIKKVPNLADRVKVRIKK